MNLDKQITLTLSRDELYTINFYMMTVIEMVRDHDLEIECDDLDRVTENTERVADKIANGFREFEETRLQ